MADDVKDEELKLREEADGSAVIGDESQVEQEDDDQDDERLTKSDDDHADDAGHDPNDTDAERAAKTEENRRRRRESKEKKKSYIEDLRRENAAKSAMIEEMNNRLAVIERKSTGSEMAQLARAEQDAVAAYNQLRDIHASAVERADGKVATEAQERMSELRDKYNRIKSIKAAYTQRQNAPQPLDPRLASHADKWMSANKWYDPSGKDEDSDIALTVDKRLAQEGWDPRTPEYWDELTDRLKKRLPHKVNSGYNQSNIRRNPPPVSGSGREGSGTQSTYKLSAARVAAIKEAGKWDDPKARAEMVKAYQAYDKENAA